MHGGRQGKQGERDAQNGLWEPSPQSVSSVDEVLKEGLDPQGAELYQQRQMTGISLVPDFERLHSGSLEAKPS